MSANKKQSPDQANSGDNRGTQPDIFLDYKEQPPTRKNVEIFCEQDGDSSKIAQYLRVISARELAQLTSQISNRESDPSPEQLVAKAIAIQFEAERQQWLHRGKLALAMNRITLEKLAQILGIEDYERLTSECSRSKWNDPVAGPVVQCLVARADWLDEWQHSALYTSKEITWDYSKEFETYFSVADPEAVVTKADKKTTLPRPAFHDQLAQALQWATNEETGFEKYLLQAFLDLLTITPCEPSIYRPLTPSERFDSEGRTLDQPELLDLEINLRNLRLNTPRSDESQKEVLQRDVDLHLELERYRKSFRPGKKAPELATKISKLAHHQYWEKFMTTSKLAWLSIYFHEFWRKHRKTYIAADPRIAQLSSVKAAAAVQRHAKAQRERCMSLINDFFDDLAGKNISTDRQEREAQFLRFSMNVAKLSKKARQEEILDLFETLHAGGDTKPKVLWKRLKSSKLERFKALPEEKQEKRLSRMKPIDQANIAKGNVPSVFKTAFEHLGEAGVEKCLELWRARSA